MIMLSVCWYQRYMSVFEVFAKVWGDCTDRTVLYARGMSFALLHCGVQWQCGPLPRGWCRPSVSRTSQRSLVISSAGIVSPAGGPDWCRGVGPLVIRSAGKHAATIGGWREGGRQRWMWPDGCWMGWKRVMGEPPGWKTGRIQPSVTDHQEDNALRLSCVRLYSVSLCMYVCIIINNNNRLLFYSAHTKNCLTALPLTLSHYMHSLIKLDPVHSKQQEAHVWMYVCMYGWMDGWMGGWMDGCCMEGWMDGWMDGQQTIPRKQGSVSDKPRFVSSVFTSSDEGLRVETFGCYKLVQICALWRVQCLYLSSYY